MLQKRTDSIVLMRTEEYGATQKALKQAEKEIKALRYENLKLQMQIYACRLLLTLKGGIQNGDELV